MIYDFNHRYYMRFIGVQANFIDVLDAKKVLDNAEDFLISLDTTSDQYVEVYPYFVEFFRPKKLLEKLDVVIGCGFTYSWMPTILKFKGEDYRNELDQAVKILNQHKSISTQEEIDFEQIEKLKPLINNSLVGLSKLLHFINPAVFPIWDSRVYRFLKGADAHINQLHLNDISYYASYVAYCHRVLKEDGATGFVSKYRQKIDYEVSGIRAIEHLMFTQGKPKGNSVSD